MAGFKFRFDEKYYTAQGAETLARDAMDDMRREYTRMRDVAQKRIKRFEGTDYVQSQTFKEKQEGFLKLKDIDPADLPKAFHDLYKFVRANRSTVTGQRIAQTKTMNTLNTSIGREGVTKQNYWRVIKILNESRKQKLVYDSDKIVEAAQATLVLDDDQFEKVLDNLEKFLVHSNEISASLAEIRDEKTGYSLVNIDDFVKQLGW